MTDQITERFNEMVRACNKAQPGESHIDVIHVEGRTWQIQPNGQFEPEFYDTEFYKMLEKHFEEKNACP